MAAHLQLLQVVSDRTGLLHHFYRLDPAVPSASQGQARRGAGRGLGIPPVPRSLHYANSFGHDDVFLESDWRARLDAKTGARGVDVVLDSVGADFRAEAIEIVTPMGRLVMFGNASGAPELSPSAGVMRAQCRAAFGHSITSAHAR